jgi:hypothetical protein
MSKFNQVLNEWIPEDREMYDSRNSRNTWSLEQHEHVINDKGIVNSIVQWAKLNNKPAPSLEPDGSLFTFLDGHVDYETIDDSDYDRESGYGEYKYDEYHDIAVDDLVYLDAGDNPVSLSDYLAKPENKNVLRDLEDVVLAKAQDRY